MRAVGEHINLIKTQRHKVYRERLRLFFEKKRREGSTYGIAFQAKFLCHYPETSSRVTLASLGNVFQTKKDVKISHK